MKRILTYIIISLLIGGCKEMNKKSVIAENKGLTNLPNAYSFTLKSIDGSNFSLKDFEGKKILIVNTASKCGYTKQYEELETLYNTYKSKLIVVGFPANDFMSQEPGTNSEIKEFCKKNYGVSFPLSEKITVVGNQKAPLYQWLTSKALNGVMDATVTWNFNKFLLNEKGELIAYYPSKINPLNSEIITKL